MIASTQFNYQAILKHSKKVDKKIETNNIIFLKKTPYSAMNTGLFIAVLVFICSLVGIFSGSMNIIEAVFAAFFVFLLVSFFSFRSLSKKMDVKSYQKIKKLQKGKPEIFQYKANIDGIYDSIGVSANTNVKYDVPKRKNGMYILIVDSQKIYLNRETYEEIKDDKKIYLYFLKKNNLCVLYDYERIEK